MRFEAPKEVKFILSTLENAGYEAFCVGGCVRDILLSITPNDYDITTNALPNQIKSLFEKTVDTGIKHGTVTVIINTIPFEVTTYRTDGDYLNHRKPENVLFVSNIKEDLLRRDFTINAIALSKNGEIVDYFGGAEDIKHKILRAVGEPRKRFTEDALRILRLFRFASRLNFTIEEETLKSALLLSPTLKNISRERIANELFEILCSNHPHLAKPLFSCGALAFLGIETAELTFLTNLEKDKKLRFCAFCLKNKIDGENLLNELKCDNATKEHFLFVKEITQKPPKTKCEIKKCLRDFSYASLIDSYKILGFNTDEIENVINSGEPYLISHLKINGDDLVSLGFKGKDIGKHLNDLCDLVISKPHLNQKETLLSLLKQNA